MTVTQLVLRISLPKATASHQRGELRFITSSQVFHKVQFWVLSFFYIYINEITQIPLNNGTHLSLYADDIKRAGLVFVARCSLLPRPFYPRKLFPWIWSITSSHLGLGHRKCFMLIRLLHHGPLARTILHLWLLPPITRRFGTPSKYLRQPITCWGIPPMHYHVPASWLLLPENQVPS